MKTQFWAVFTDTPGELDLSKSAVGPFASLRSVEDWLKSDAAETFLDADKSCRELNEDDHWAGPVQIVEMVKCVRQRPVVRIDVRLDPCKPNE